MKQTAISFPVQRYVIFFFNLRPIFNRGDRGTPNDSKRQGSKSLSRKQICLHALQTHEIRRLFSECCDQTPALPVPAAPTALRELPAALPPRQSRYLPNCAASPRSRAGVQRCPWSRRDTRMARAPVPLHIQRGFREQVRPPRHPQQFSVLSNKQDQPLPNHKGR